MFFKEFKCEKCGNFTLSMNYDATIDAYIENEFNIEHLLILSEEKPPCRPGYIIFTCMNNECKYSIKMQEVDILKNLLDEWAEMAWAMSKYYANHAHQFEQYRTRYLYDDRIKQFIKNNREGPYLDTAEVYNDYLTFIKDERKKHTK